MQTTKDFIIGNNRSRAIVADFFAPAKEPALKELVIFCHGYKGFKDWGAWDEMGKAFVADNYYFLKFNFSHNGGTADQPIDFPDLEAFGRNNYSTEVEDLHVVLDAVKKEGLDGLNFDKIHLIAHSRGGGIACITSTERNDIDSITTLAGVADYAQRFPSGQDLLKWKEEGVYYVKNGRTKQEMPHYHQFYQDFQENSERLNIQRAVKSIQIPHLIIHGDTDETVSVDEARLMAEWNPHAKLVILPDTGHTFGSKHPWNEKEFPEELKNAIGAILSFLGKP
jgi:pimeloyl-ACP methyl ester carboxylesterase